MTARNKRTGAALALAAVIAVVLVLVLGSGSSSSDGGTKTPSYSGTATVRRRNLVATDTESGTLSYANPQTVYNSLSGTITWLPTAGQVIRPGQALFDIDNSPVLLMNGSTPAYRNLTASDSPGPDIYELNRALVSLGYDPYWITLDNKWQAATTDGVKAMQKAEGWQQTGTLTLGQIVFLPGSQMVATLVGTLGSGGGGGASTEILTTTSTQLVVTVDLGASLQSEATPHEPVTVEMPDESTVAGRITAVSPVAESSSSGDDGEGDSGGGSGDSGSSSTVPITITLNKRANGAGLDQAAVSVNFTQAKANHVLSVPVTALIATAGQHFAVQESAAPRRLIAVTTGLFAAGYVEISGAGVYQGLEVTDSQG